MQGKFSFVRLGLEGFGNAVPAKSQSRVFISNGSFIYPQLLTEVGINVMK